MTRRVEVELRSARGRVVEEVDVSVVATDAAAVDMARRQAGISTAEFETGRVIA
ncbi:hypothetical protein [Halorubrum cibi]|uniref:Uncharacterized protein n=1 Tax=Halorubrum cibi TaxID=413815 RepID=A0A521F3N8_9EURY|nr:hypothetical protein [Halorubrum cibi]SMO90784.1 hypothetical protein SAMN06264867_1189 [Halorubrum cibi]